MSNESERTCINKAIERNRLSPCEYKTDDLVCSNCGETTYADNIGINSPIDWAFCPHCGARVVEE